MGELSAIIGMLSAMRWNDCPRSIGIPVRNRRNPHYRWATKGSRPRAVHDQRTQSTYVFGAVCPVRGAGTALVLPACNTEAMQLHLDDIATQVTPGAHAVVVLDQAGWHKSQALKVPSNLSLMPLPPRSPALNPHENI